MLLTVTGERFDAETLRVYPVDDHPLNFDLRDQNDRLHGILWTRQVATGVLKVVAFALTPPAQGQGHVTWIWDRLLHLASERFETLTLEVHDGNQRAIRFYERRGLRTTARLPLYYGRGDGLRMEGPINRTTDRAT